jgi:membrane protease YdiL (CAAX protease family)
MSAAAAEEERVKEAPAERQAGPVEMTPESRRLHYLEIALVLSVGFLWSMVYSLIDWWGNAEPSPGTLLNSLRHIGDAAISLSVLAYVLYRQGRSLRKIGLTFRRSDLLWAVVVWSLNDLMRRAVHWNVHGFASLKSLPVGYDGALHWLAVIPGAAKEELIVRAFLMTEVAELSGSWALAVFASVGFQTLYHLYLGTGPALMAAGGFFVYAVFYASTRRITPVILSHSLHNFLYLAGW